MRHGHGIAGEPTDEYHVVGFQLAPPGWVIVLLGPGGEWAERPMPGWLIEEAVSYRGGIPVPKREQYSRPWRRVVAASHSRDEMRPASEVFAEMGFWKVLAPSDPETTGEEIEQELAHRKRIQRARHLAGEKLGP
jgi:hypothetical protein